MTRRRKPQLLAAIVVVCGGSVHAAAQSPGNPQAVSRNADTPLFSLRPFVMGMEQSFSAVNTFEAAFGRAYHPFLGGGLQVVVRRQYFVEVTASRFRRTGERAFRHDDQNFRLGLPLIVEIKPFEITGGFRFDRQTGQIFVPYAGAGLGSYGYKETSPSSDPEENLDVRHRGFVVVGGAEFRLHRWIRLGTDVQYTRVPGILGAGGISKAAGEDDLGGIAARLKILVGR